MISFNHMFFTLLPLFLTLAAASLLRTRPPTEAHSTPIARSVVDTNGVEFEYWFDQLVDHNDPSAGTFKQRYFFSDKYWKGDGSPIILQTPGETSADGWWAFLKEGVLHSKMMESLGAAGIVLEHRYWGKSSPVPDLSTDNLRWLTVEQGIEDLKYFAENVQLPVKDTSTRPDVTPWVNIGCSYSFSGLLTSYAQEKYPDVFAAAYATSAPVQADGDFWEYWEPIEEGMPWNCSSDMAAAIAYIDDTFMNGTSEDVQVLKTKFGSESLQDDDFATRLLFPFNTWQDLQASSFQQEGQATFFKFCDALETREDGSINQSDEGIGMPLALENLASIHKAIADENCPNTGGSCFSTYNYTEDPGYVGVALTNPLRGWQWLLCTQLGVWQIGGHSSIVSQMLTPESSARKCAHMFPPSTGPANTSLYNTTASAEALNLNFGGWNLIAKNLFVVNGEFDPWRSASLSSRAAPAFVDTPTQEITVIPNGHHCWDWTMANAAVNADVMQTQDLGISKIRGWLTDWYEAHPNIDNNLPAAPLDPEMAARIASMNNAMQGMQDDINKLWSEKRGAIASYALNGILAVAFLVALGLFFRERSRRSPRKPIAREPPADPQESTVRLLNSSPRQSVEQEAWRVSKYSDPF